VAAADSDRCLVELGELALERLVDELLELGAVRLGELGDPSLDVDERTPSGAGASLRRSAPTRHLRSVARPGVDRGQHFGRHFCP